MCEGKTNVPNMCPLSFTRQNRGANWLHLHIQVKHAGPPFLILAPYLHFLKQVQSTCDNRQWIMKGGEEVAPPLLP